MGELTLSEGRLFGAFLEAFLYGINVILVLAVLCLFAQHKKPSAMQRFKAGVIILIFVLCTIHLAAVSHSIHMAFFVWSSSDEYFKDYAQAPNIIANATYGVAVLVADGLLIHRLYVVFGNEWKVIIIPGLNAIAAASVWFVLVHIYRTVPDDLASKTVTIDRLAPAAYILSFVTNVVITVKIIIGILLAMRAVRHLRPASEAFHRRCLAYTVESGILYPLSLLTTGILWFLKNNSLEILAGSNLQLLCMVPILLSLQMRLNLSIYDTAKGLSDTSPPINNSIGHPTRFRRISLTNRRNAFDMQPPAADFDVECGSTLPIVHRGGEPYRTESIAMSQDSTSIITSATRISK